MLHLNVVTPERAFLSEDCKSVTCPGLMGEMQILAGHTPILAELKPGIVTIENNKSEPSRFMVSHGFIEVDNDSVNLLCDFARHRDEIDQEQAEQDHEKLLTEMSELKEKDSDKFKRLNAELDSNVASLKLLE